MIDPFSTPRLLLCTEEMAKRASKVVARTLLRAHPALGELEFIDIAKADAKIVCTEAATYCTDSDTEYFYLCYVFDELHTYYHSRKSGDRGRSRSLRQIVRENVDSMWFSMSMLGWKGSVWFGSEITDETLSEDMDICRRAMANVRKFLALEAQGRVCSRIDSDWLQTWGLGLLDIANGTGRIDDEQWNAFKAQSDGGAALDLLELWLIP